MHQRNTTDHVVDRAGGSISDLFRPGPFAGKTDRDQTVFSHLLQSSQLIQTPETFISAGIRLMLQFSRNGFRNDDVKKPRRRPVNAFGDAFGQIAVNDHARVRNDRSDGDGSVTVA